MEKLQRPIISFKIKQIIPTGKEERSKAIIEAIMLIELKHSKKELWCETDYFLENKQPLQDPEKYVGLTATAELDLVESVLKTTKGNPKKNIQNTVERKIYYGINGKIVEIKSFDQAQYALVDCGLEVPILVNIPKQKFKAEENLYAEGWFWLRMLKLKK